MTTVAPGPYEHRGAYGDLAESEVFDTSGVDILFCRHCEHTPCVAGGTSFCTCDPRFITAEHYARTILEAAERVATPLNPAFEAAINAVSEAAWDRTAGGDRALVSLVRIRSRVRKAVLS